jgi:hypothetical protein
MEARISAKSRRRGREDFPVFGPGATAMRAGTFLERPHQRVADTSNRPISHSIMLLMQVDRIDFIRSRKMEENGLDPSSSHFGGRRSVNVIAGLDPAIGSGTGSAKMPLNPMAIAGTDPRNKSEDDEKAVGPAKMRTATRTIATRENSMKTPVPKSKRYPASTRTRL